MTKVQYRKMILEKRDALGPDEVSAFENTVCLLFMASPFADIPASSSVMAYSSFRNEAGTGALISSLYEAGTRVVLPKTRGGLIFPFVYNGPDSMETGAFGISEPSEEKCSPALLSEIRTVIVPGVCFDPSGARIGFGKGCYDRFLPGLSPDAVKIGLCYEFQIIEEGLPSEDHDVLMDWLLTEKGFFNCKTRSYKGL